MVSVSYQARRKRGPRININAIERSAQQRVRCWVPSSLCSSAPAHCSRYAASNARLHSPCHGADQPIFVLDQASCFAQKVPLVFLLESRASLRRGTLFIEKDAIRIDRRACLCYGVRGRLLFGVLQCRALSTSAQCPWQAPQCFPASPRLVPAQCGVPGT